MNWKNNPYFKKNGSINLDENRFVYMNLNPGNIPGQQDQLFQILKFFNKDKTNRDIAEIIKEEKINKSVMRIKSYGTVLKKNINCAARKLDKKIVVKDFPGDIKFDTTWVIVEIKNNIELYNTKEDKFYGCHRILENSKITKCWEVADEIL